MRANVFVFYPNKPDCCGFGMYCSHKDGCLYEMDGRKSFPINHGATTPETLLQDACAVIKEFLERDPGESGFAVTALAATESD